MISRAQYVALFRRLSASNANFAECIKIQRQDGVTYRYTAHDKPLRLKEEDGLFYTYKPAGALELTAVETTLGLSVSNMNFTVFVEDDDMLTEDFESGKFILAKLHIYLAYWKNEQVAALPVKIGWVGEIVKEDNQYKTDVRGIAQLLAQKFIDTTSLECRYVFGDPATCGVDLTPFTVETSVLSVSNRSVFTVADTLTTLLYEYGTVSFTSGANEGLNMEIMRQSNDTLQLFLPMANDVGVGDLLTVSTGCSKTYTRCGFYNNQVRFGGEPFLETPDLLLGT